ncbi:MAG: zf-HC2 domain-containing protein [Ruminococcus sp.]|nr:zf-HC2 domain-containing protein [Ruminococcus sp.]
MKCEIIKDLIPLSAEGLCSDESEKEIQEHIRECDSCRLLYEKLPEKQEDIKIPDEKETFKKVNRKFKKLSIKSGIIIAILIVVFTALGWLTYNQITKAGSLISFETIFQSMEVRKIANYIADGDFESYVDSISRGDRFEIQYINHDDLKKKDIQLLQQAFQDAYGDTKVTEIRVQSYYDGAAEMIYDASDAYSVYNVVNIIFENGKDFTMYLRRNKDGKYIADYHYITEYTSDIRDISDEEIAFYNAVNFANYHDMSTYGLTTKLLMSNKTSEKATSMYAGRFRKEYRNQVNESRNNLINKGYTITNAYFSYARYDTEKDMPYYEVTIQAEDSKGSAVMTTRIYFDYMGFYPPEKDSINIFNNNCTSELEEALYNFFG